MDNDKLSRSTPALVMLVEIALLFAIVVGIICVLGGCMSATYRDTAGNELTIKKFCWETKIGHLEASNGSSRIVVENYDSESQAVKLADDALKLAAAMAVKP